MVKIDFNTVNPNDLWYIIGYIVADGNLSGDGRHISIISKDIDHLEKIRSAIKLNSRVEIRIGSGYGKKENKYGRIQFSSARFYRFLNQINIFPNKSLTQSKVLIDFEYVSDFIRGVIDGDGCIRHWIHPSNKHTQWCTSIASGSKSFAEWILDVIQNTYLICGSIQTFTQANRNPIYSVRFGKLASQVLLKSLYYPESVNLSQKKILAHLCLLDASKMVNYNSVICPGGEIGYTRRT